MPAFSIRSLDGSTFDAYAAMPSVGQGPGLIVIQSTPPVDTSVRGFCDRQAQAGFIAIAPDLFWRRHGAVDSDAALRDLLATLAHLRRLPRCNGKIGVVELAPAGALSWLMASRSDVDATVCFGGQGLAPVLDEVYDIRTPFLLHLIETEEQLSEAARQKIMTAVTRNPLITALSYSPDEAFDAANFRTAEFLKRHLMKG